MMNRHAARVAGCALLAAATLGCRQDMHDQPRLDPLEASRFFEDGAAARPTVAETVARGLLEDDDHFYRGRVDGAPATTIPMAMTAELLDRGRVQYDIYCAPCHARTGDGRGIVVQLGFPAPPSFHSEYLAFASEGSMFDAISNGFGEMPDYRQEIAVEDRWAIVAYIRALQFSQYADAATLPQADRDRLEDIR